jgi:tRNA (cytidine/uridine-2'-O-)-methyltransferase
MQLALFQPDIPQNTGTILRLGACLGVPVHIIEPTGFDASDRALRRAALDYLEHVQIQRHASFEAFEAWRGQVGGRLILLTTKTKLAFTDLEFERSDILLLGRESAGVPEDIHEKADVRIVVPIVSGLRSLNVAAAAAMVLGEALRQTDGFRRG